MTSTIIPLITYLYVSWLPLLTSGYIGMTFHLCLAASLRDGQMGQRIDRSTQVRMHYNLSGTLYLVL